MASGHHRGILEAPGQRAVVVGCLVGEVASRRQLGVSV